MEIESTMGCRKLQNQLTWIELRGVIPVHNKREAHFARIWAIDIAIIVKYVWIWIYNHFRGTRLFSLEHLKERVPNLGHQNLLWV